MLEIRPSCEQCTKSFRPTAQKLIFVALSAPFVAVVWNYYKMFVQIVVEDLFPSYKSKNRLEKWQLFKELSC